MNVKIMITPNQSAARAIEANASNIAATACNLFIREQPQLENERSVDIYESWSHHFKQRVMELSAAVAAGEPQLFTSRVEWSRQAMSARFVENINLADSLKQLRSVVKDILPADETVEALHCLDEAIKTYDLDLPQPEISQLDPHNPHQRLALFYLQAALEGDVQGAMQIILDAVADGLTESEAIMDVLLAAQREVGHLWHLDQITIAEEHVVTTTTQRLMAVIASNAKRGQDTGKTAVAASIAGNAHDIGIRAIAYLMELDGWRVIFLGPDLPRNNLPAAIHFYDADVVLLSLALNSQLSNLRDTIDEIKQTDDSGVKIMVGGNAFREAPDVWKTMGADGFADTAERAISLAHELTDSVVTH